MNTPTDSQLTPLERRTARAYQQLFERRLISAMTHGRELARIDRAVTRMWGCNCKGCIAGASIDRIRIAKTVWPLFARWG